ncbi:MAG: hypothetical protein HQL14_08865, partial [Candidatus Omnitrophica bacterium]|nr:hypothetical protein [Candidatus Omnitrophota bacterium]
LCYLIAHYYFLKHFTNKKWAAVGIALLCSASFLTFQATLEYRAIFLLFYNIVPIFLLLYWHKQRHDGLLLLAGTFAGFATFTKLEAAGHCLIYPVILGLLLNNLKANTRIKFETFLKFLLPLLVIYLFFYSVKASLHLPFMEGRETLSVSVNYFTRIVHTMGTLFNN